MEEAVKKRKWTRKTKIILILLLIGFCAMEFPGVFFFQKKITPFLFGLPFIYGYILCWWFYMCAVLFYAYKINWGFSKKTQR